MKKFFAPGIAATVTVFVVSTAHGAWEINTPGLTERIREQIEALSTNVRPPHENETFYHASAALGRVYEARGYRPLWLDGPAGDQRTNELIAAVKAAEDEGLRPTDYHLNRLEARAGNLRFATATTAAAFELLLSDAFLLLGSHYVSGRINPETLSPEWIAQPRSVDMTDVLETAVKTGRIRETLESLLPSSEDYRRLRSRLKANRSRKATAPWETIPPGSTLKPGADDLRVPALRRRLIQSEDYRNADDSSTVYDAALELALKRFQTRHGLDVDGVLGPATLAALNEPLDKRIARARVNMERWRWLPADLGRRHVLVNIAGFSLALVEDGKTVSSHRVIVGRNYRKSPVFSDRMTYLVFNPTWTLPPQIAKEDKVPLFRKDPGAVVRENFTVYDGWSPTAKKLDPASIDWSRVRPTAYRIVQGAGPENALGRVKFMFPNKFDVYLHDTPARDLFAKARRVFSSGCIRVQDPLVLAERLLEGTPNWTRAEIDAVIASGTERTVRLATAVPVHLLYWTAWIDDEGQFQFREDIYDRDDAVLEALDAPLRPGG